MPPKTRFNTEEIRNMRITVMGIGRFGGGYGAVRYLAGMGAHITVTDLKGEDELSEQVSELRGLGIKFVLGRHEMSDFTDSDMVVVNPAVPGDSEYVKAARSSGAILQTEIGLFVNQCPALVNGVTGSNGKTTTVSMIRSILEHSGKKSWVGGNIGGSLLQSLPQISSDGRSWLLHA